MAQSWEGIVHSCISGWLLDPKAIHRIGWIRHCLSDRRKQVFTSYITGCLGDPDQQVGAEAEINYNFRVVLYLQVSYFTDLTFKYFPFDLKINDINVLNFILGL